jgi:hypothetical protein
MLGPQGKLGPCGGNRWRTLGPSTQAVLSTPGDRAGSQRSEQAFLVGMDD